MLVLSRKRDEKIVIGAGQIVLTIIEVRRDKVRIGIWAPQFGVVRSEVLEDGMRPGPPPPSDGTGLLVLSRKKDEKILIGDNVDIMVVDIQGDKVRLGIEAPRDVTVHREEVYIAIQKKANQI